MAASAASPFCVGAQTSQRSGVQRAVAFIGSIVAWFWYGYVHRFDPPRRAASAAARVAVAVADDASAASSPSVSIAAIVAVEAPGVRPVSHSTCSASSAVLACH